MKVTLQTILLVGTATMALARPEPEAKKAKGVLTRCTVPGLACGKRTADPSPEAKEAKGVLTRCTVPGLACGKRTADPLFRCTAPGIACGKREADAFAIPGISETRDAEADAEALQARGLDRCSAPGIGCEKRDAEAGQSGFCGLPGEACSRAKRSALAIADAFAEADPDSTGLCGVDGQACARARRSINEVGIAAEHVYNTVSAAEKRYVSYHTFDEKTKRWEPPSCGVRGFSCAKARDQLMWEHKRYAEAKKAKGVLTRCTVPGLACGKRELEEASLLGSLEQREAEAEASPDGFLFRCTAPGIACAKREADAEPKKAKGVLTRCTVPGLACGKREAEPLATKAKGVLTRCTVPGLACGKRDAEADPKKAKGVLTRCTVPGLACGRKRDAEAAAEAKKAKGVLTRCTVPGLACGKREAEAEAKKAKGVLTRCTVPGLACGKRDLETEHALEARCGVRGYSCPLARDVVDQDSEFAERDAAAEPKGLPKKYVVYKVPRVIKKVPLRKGGSLLYRCTVPGFACGKRDYEADGFEKVAEYDHEDEPTELESRDPKKAKGVLTRCTVPGLACGKRDLEADGWEAIDERDLTDFYNVEAHEAKKAKGVLTRCTVPGLACGKREAEAAATKAKGVLTRCTVPGLACGKREAEAAAYAEAKKAKGVLTRCTVPGLACGKRDVNAEIIARGAMIRGEESLLDAGTEALAKRCGVAGMSCTRDYDDETHIDHNDDQNGYCGVNGEDCATTLRRNAEPTKAKGVLTRCTVPGLACGKRAAEAEAEAEADPKKAKGVLTRCTVPGLACGKRETEAEAEAGKAKGVLTRCTVPGLACGKRELMARDDIAEEDVVNSITASDPEYFTNECNKQGGECHAIQKAHRMFMEAKREAEQAAAHGTDLVARAGFCDTHDCTFATRRWIEEAANNADDAFDEYEHCHAEDGDCTNVKRALDELEETLEAAVKAL
ncbi:hypothetical protein DOTSEDRAFT_56778 [Dothistroma septosporum NZE10]|uniref:Uncharacterized protein n=1 Tax=Dothistroma septosporum (strain NZE10 / CBS 128990) TaxID=675120 RepID=M2Y240_DOTSN|nr:hypothetical protein DOTSEDRAFT_56778 [Dothistroma septosporum NZE10]